jgi:hypothetical protein
LIDPSHKFALHPDQVLDSKQQQAFLDLRRDEKYPEELRNDLVTQYARKLRGKSLLAILVKHVNSRNQGAKHSTSGLIESAVLKPGDLLNRLQQNVMAQFACLGSDPRQ